MLNSYLYIFQKSSLLFLLLSVASCDSGAGQSKAALLNSARISDNSQVFGDWAICAELDRGRLMQYNSCEPIRFERDGSGVLQRVSGGEERFLWKLEGKRLRILHLAYRPGYRLQDTVYTAVPGLEGTVAELQLALPGGQQVFYLTREH